MTKKRYSNARPVSRSELPSRGRYPFERRYAALQGDGPHPLDAIIDQIPAIRSLDRKLVGLSRRVQADTRDPKRYIAFEDLRLEQRALREAAFYDAGHQQGRIEGAAKSADISTHVSSEGRAFARWIHIVQLASGLTPEDSVAVLLEVARGLVVEGRGDRRSGRSRPRAQRSRGALVRRHSLISPS